VVIVGAAAIGLATAFYLAANHGVTRVAVLEKGYVGSGQCRAQHDIVRSNYMIGATRSSSSSRCSSGGAVRDPQLQRHAVATRPGRDGAWAGAARRAGAARQHHALNGIDAELLDRGEVMRLLPYLD